MLTLVEELEAKIQKASDAINSNHLELVGKAVHSFEERLWQYIAVNGAQVSGGGTRCED